MVAAMLIPTLGFAVWVLAEAGGQSKIDPQTLAIASQNAREDVIAITGTEHTVYHANGPLAEAKAPRTDGRLTVAWFTKTTCTVCTEQEFVHAVMSEFRDDVVFVEKEVARDTADERLGVKDVPTFVVLDARGGELDRFTDPGTPEALRERVAALIGSN